jgi:uncharacterized membrane protein
MMDMDKLISNVLRTGVIISLILILIGTVLLFADNGSNGFTMAQIINVNSKINSSIFSIAGMVNGLFSLQGADFILLGIIVLILTPITRVITSVLSFLYERNWLYVIITVIVFIDIMVAIFIVPVILGH